MGSGLTETANDASIMHPDGFKELAGLLMCFSAQNQNRSQNLNVFNGM